MSNETIQEMENILKLQKKLKKQQSESQKHKITNLSKKSL